MFLSGAVAKAWRQLGMPGKLREQYDYKPQVIWYNYTAGNNKMVFFFDAYMDPCEVSNKIIEATYIASENVIAIDIYNLESHNSYKL
ncbi:hypothetical protein FC41_GL000028 [Lactobacillus hominis DSM 23910 = CRBIP 24.179]|nr:hypothetical protein FC41_GL000028 [Lactobacillus hominis DSM 23910 = CRBIP 24.179]